MPKTKARKKRGNHLKVDNLKKKKALREHHQERIKGGKTPLPGGPIPIPYPNTPQKGS